MKTNHLLEISLFIASLAVASCSKSGGYANDASDQDGPREEAGAWTESAAADTAEATENSTNEVGNGLETAADETEDAFNDAGDQVDDEPTN